MGVYCFKISNHGIQHAVVTMHIVTEADQSESVHLAPETSAFSLAPRTHISRANVIIKHLTAQTLFSATTRDRQQFTCRIPLQAVYICAAAVCVSPCSLVISTQSSCTIWCTSDNESEYQWTSDCLPTPCIGILTSAANPCGACNCQL